jgi:hypothetical protein
MRNGRKIDEFNGSDQTNEAFKILKICSQRIPILRIFDFKLFIQIKSDASEIAKAYA